MGLVFCYSHIQRICEEMDRFFFLESTVKCGSLPILYQTITDNFFRKMINAAFPVISQEHTGLTTVPAALSYQELNIIRYAAGYS